MRCAGSGLPIALTSDMAPDLATTNIFLGVIAVVSVLEMAGLVLVSIGIFLLTRRIRRLIEVVEEKQLAPAATRLHSILDDVKAVTHTVRRFAPLR